GRPRDDCAPRDRARGGKQSERPRCYAARGVSVDGSLDAALTSFSCRGTVPKTRREKEKQRRQQGRGQKRHRRGRAATFQTAGETSRRVVKSPLESSGRSFRAPAD
ncbi:hypothetical protein IscW_ISCW023224, partial [Ixodes scapularis]